MNDESTPPLLVLQQWILHHPIAAQAAFAALAAEGRRFSATPEGADLRRRVAQSALVHRARDAWDTLTAGALVEDEDVLIPSPVIEALARAVSHAGVRTEVTESGDGR